ncbi:hypothetical protein [Desulfoluna sp.]|uniref:hypothetical protein n=1 Tax=Desulfoluna sp. TaxID=2045199 RepID=UPI002610E063|nr:hypothetical protein [Desulfoluna sp.]
MGTLVCRLEISKEKGIVVTAENRDDNITQTFILDGTRITTTVAGPSETSTIIQDSDSIKVSCKTFSLDAETITCTSTKKTHLESREDFEIKSGAVAVTADRAAEYSALDTTITSSSATTVKGTTLAMEGTASAELTGASIKLEAKGLMDLISNGIATLKGSISNIKGIVKLG